MTTDTIIKVNAKQLALITAGLQHLPFFKPNAAAEINALRDVIRGYTDGDLADMARDEANADEGARLAESCRSNIPQTDAF